ncbi:MAG: hypothetical protein Ta2F_07550 [Termitinemataceae bacterium]|nr:MAG: hypothetical protein Ta2F_07550 [Termitinemataceae bacterium]
MKKNILILLTAAAILLSVSAVSCNNVYTADTSNPGNTDAVNRVIHPTTMDQILKISVDGKFWPSSGFNPIHPTYAVLTSSTMTTSAWNDGAYAAGTPIAITFEHVQAADPVPEFSKLYSGNNVQFGYQHDGTQYLIIIDTATEAATNYYTTQAAAQAAGSTLAQRIGAVGNAFYTGVKQANQGDDAFAEIGKAIEAIQGPDFGNKESIEKVISTLDAAITSVDDDAPVGSFNNPTSGKTDLLAALKALQKYLSEVIK